MLKKFPKQYEEETFIDQSNSYVRYRRRHPGNGEHEAYVNDRHLTNEWIVPYSPYLALKYNCHINVEICASSRAAKYLHKYVTKGGDRMMMRVDNDGNVMDRNEVKEYQDNRSIGSSEAAWRLLEFEMTDR